METINYYLNVFLSLELIFKKHIFITFIILLHLLIL